MDGDAVHQKSLLLCSATERAAKLLSMRTRSLLLTPLIVGCYNYAAVNPTSVPQGTEVRAKITGAASDRIAPQLGTFDTREITGNVVANDNGAMTLEVPTGAIANTGESIIPLHQRVQLNPADFVSLETRRLDVVRSSIMAGAVVAGLGVIAAVALHSKSEATDYTGGEPGAPPINRIPLIRFRF